MEHSLIVEILTQTGTFFRLNPYSNGTLSDVSGRRTLVIHITVLILILMEHSLIPYQRALYLFTPFPFSNKILLKIRKLIHLECYFRKSTNLKCTFQIKKSLFPHTAFISNELRFRKRDIHLNNFIDLRK